MILIDAFLNPKNRDEDVCTFSAHLMSGTVGGGME